jgi:hypothetical protein
MTLIEAIGLTALPFLGSRLVNACLGTKIDRNWSRVFIYLYFKYRNDRLFHIETMI